MCILYGSRSGNPAAQKNMTEIEQSDEVRDAIIPAFLEVFGRNGSREAEMPKDLVAAFLKDCHVLWMSWFENEIEARYEATGGGLEIIADVLQDGFEDPKCFGLAFIDIVAGREAEAFTIAKMQREHLRRFIEQLAEKMGLQHPEMAAAAAVLVVEQAITRTQITGSLEEARLHGYSFSVSNTLSQSWRYLVIRLRCPLGESLSP